MVQVEVLNPEVLKNYEEFWKPIIQPVKGDEGGLEPLVDMYQVMKELSDYSRPMDNAAEVYCHVTGGMLSKINTDPKAVIQFADERIEEAVAEAIKEMFDEPYSQDEAASLSSN